MVERWVCELPYKDQTPAQAIQCFPIRRLEELAVVIQDPSNATISDWVIAAVDCLVFLYVCGFLIIAVLEAIKPASKK